MTTSSKTNKGFNGMKKITPTDEELELQAEIDALNSAQQAEEEAKGQWGAEQQQFEDEHGHDEGDPGEQGY